MDEYSILNTQFSLENLHNMSDETLCGLSKDGFRDAEEVLAARHARTVRRLARPYFLAGGDSEDLIQEGMLGLINAIRSFDEHKSGFQTFLTVCVQRRIYTAIRDAQGTKNAMLNMALSFEQLSGENGSVDSNIHFFSQTDPESFVIDREESVFLNEKINTLLSAFEKKVLTLYLDGLSYAEMSLILNRPAKSIDNAVQRIRKKLTHLI